MPQPVKIISSQDCLDHDTGSGHPESPQRVDRLLGRIKNTGLDCLSYVEPPLGTKEQVLGAHTKRYWDFIEGQKPGATPHKIDEDTLFSRGSFAAALYGVGAVCMAVEDAINGNLKRAFIPSRPPSHHACRDKSMGFCIFNAVAAGAKWALKKGLSRVAIIDFDVHHGNGTQDIVADDPNILFISLQEKGIWPYNDADQVSHETLLNIGLEKHTSAETYRKIFQQQVIPKLKSFAPELIIISAGFDAHLNDPPKTGALFNDPTGEQSLTDEDFYWLTQEIINVAQQTAKGRVISALEGGYNLDVLPQAALSHIKALAEIA